MFLYLKYRLTKHSFCFCSNVPVLLSAYWLSSVIVFLEASAGFVSVAFLLDGCISCQWRTPLRSCAGLGRDRVNFHHSSYYGAMFLDLCWKECDNTETFSLLLSSAHTASRPFLLLALSHKRVGWGCTRSREGTQPGQLTPADQRGIPNHIMSCSARK